ncbi:hypothetical protein NC651_022557 [Populus alba x Populus x berolinensis]|nr:hypothetical protein NC651_022557 [Populus alba x Populus x berolinensis]
MARLFARRGVKATIVSTPLNAPLCSKTIERDRQLGLDISIHIIKFPSAEAGLPEGCENLKCHPNCLVANMMFLWATGVVDKVGIPRLNFNETSFFCMFFFDSQKRCDPHKRVVSVYQILNLLYSCHFATGTLKIKQKENI